MRLPPLLAGTFTALAFLAAACAPARATDADGWRAIDVTSAPVALDAEDAGFSRVGGLDFAGGVALDSNDAEFGGLSGLEITDDGMLYAVTDDGGVLTARLRLDEAGRLIGVTDARMGRLRDENGVPFATKDAGDAEGLALLPDGRFAVSFEQTQSVRLYDFANAGAASPATPGPPLAGADVLDPNEGPEALSVTEDGVLIVGAERTGRADTFIWRAPLTGDAPVSPGYSLPLDFGYGLVSFDRLPDGDFLAMERFFAPVIGVRIRILRIEGASLQGQPGQARANLLADLRAPMTLDNFEGAAFAYAPNGVGRIYLISDDNFSGRQRTLLFAFDLLGDR